MIRKLKTSLAYTKNIISTGAIAPFSKKVGHELCKNLSGEKDKIFVEFGLGHGNITKAILEAISKDAVLYSFEVNEKFCAFVREEIKDPRLVIINDGAQHIKKYIKEPIGGVVSTIPFSFFSKDKQQKIIQDSYDLLEDKTFYAQALYSKLLFNSFDSIFDKTTITSERNNIPKAYIYQCQKMLF